MTIASWRPTLIVAGLLALLTTLLIESRNADLVLSTRMHESLRTYALHEAELNRDVLLTRVGLLQHYDALAVDRKNLRETIDHLRATAAGSPRADAALRGYVDALAIALDAKLYSVDHFTSTNALSRNSLMYLALAAPDLHLPVQNQAFSSEIGHLSYAVLRFFQAPDHERELDIEATLDRLSNAAGGQSLDLPTVVAHGRLVVRALPQADLLLRDIMNASTAGRARELQVAMLRYSNEVEARAQAARIALYAVSLLLLAYLVHQFNRLRLGARRLAAANAELTREMEQRALATTALRVGEERLRAITESAREAIVTIDSAGCIASWNAGATAMFGPAAALVLGRRLATFLVPGKSPDYEQLFTAMFRQEPDGPLPGAREFLGVDAAGEEIPLEVSLALWSTQQGRFLTAIMRDVSERTRLQEVTRQQEIKLIQANKMTALGTLVASVAHEVNNPNQLVLMNAGVLAEVWKDALPVLDEYANGNPRATLGGLPYTEMRATVPVLTRDMRDGALRIERIVQDLKDFVRPPVPGAPEVFDLNEVTRRAIRLLAHPIQRRTTRFQVNLAPAIPLARGDGQQFEQVVINLVTNALEALPGSDRGVSVATRLDPGTRRIELMVADEGAGIAAEHLEHLCDPFFTTKQASGGTGLGLAITASLLRAHGARLRFESALERGTRAIVDIECAGHNADTAPLVVGRPE